MNFALGSEEAMFGETVRAIVEEHRPAEWRPGAAIDDSDLALAALLEEKGLREAAAERHGFIAAAAIELGRSLAPLSLFDSIAVEGAALAVDGLARYPMAHAIAIDLRDDGAFLTPLNGAEPQPALDSQGFVQLAAAGTPTACPALDSWARMHTGYLAGLASQMLSLAVKYARTREQFGRPLMTLAPVQQMLADAAVLAQGLELLAWDDVGNPWPSLLHAGEAATRVCEVSHQVHGAIGYALESKLHSFFRRAHATRIFTRAVARAVRVMPTIA